MQISDIKTLFLVLIRKINANSDLKTLFLVPIREIDANEFGNKRHHV